MASLRSGSSLDLLEVEPDAAGLDLRHVEDVVDQVEQVLAALVDVAAYSRYFSVAERAEHARLHDLGEADDGVERRAQLVAHIGEELRFRLVGVLGAGLLLGVFLGEVGELVGLVLQRQLRVRRSATVAISRFSLSISFTSCSSGAVMSVPTET